MKGSSDVSRHYLQLMELASRLSEEARNAIDNVAKNLLAESEISHVPTHAVDGDYEGLDREVALEAKRDDMLKKIEHALQQIHEGKYGQCENCGAPIPTARLDALPFATRCVVCEEELERSIEYEHRKER